MKLFRLLPMVLLLACEENHDAEHALDAMWFTDVHLTGPAWFGCGKHEYGRRFTARNMQERQVSGVVCCGFGFKMCTVRF